jgi:hypothetical protein
VIGFVFRRFRWMIIGAGVRQVARWGAARSIDEATAAIEDRLPASVVRAANAMPGDVLRVGGAAAVSARAARRTTSLAARTSTGIVRFGPRQRRRLGARIDAARFDLADAAENARRELKSDYARFVDGEGAALEALLDLRDVESEPIPPVPAPVAAGRRRFRRSLPSADVARVQRTYKRPVKAWDRDAVPTSRNGAGNTGDDAVSGR